MMLSYEEFQRLDGEARRERREAALYHFLIEHASSLKKYEAAERAYAEVTAAYRERYGDTVTADYRAASDPRLRQAIQDCAFYRERATLYGISALVELTRGGLK